MEYYYDQTIDVATKIELTITKEAIEASIEKYKEILSTKKKNLIK